MKKLLQRGILNALGVSVYIALIATFIQYGEKMFGDINQFFAPIAFLLLFVISASITGGLVLGKPILMYLDGQKKDAVQLFLYTIGCLASIMIIVLLLALNI